MLWFSFILLGMVKYDNEMVMYDNEMVMYDNEFETKESKI